MYKIALVGNPNSGKSSIFNLLTGMRQKVSNFPGVTVDKKEGYLHLGENLKVSITDFPGCYSFYPNSADERIVVDILCNPENKDYPDLIVYVADSTQLERHLLLATQIADLGFPMIFVLNMIDLAGEGGLDIDTGKLSDFISVPVVTFSGKTKHNISQLKQLIEEYFDEKNKHNYYPTNSFYKISSEYSIFFSEINQIIPSGNEYNAKILAHNYAWMNSLDHSKKKTIGQLCVKGQFKDLPLQVEEIMHRYDVIIAALPPIFKNHQTGAETFTDRMDKWITHKWVGPLLYLIIMFIVFQAIFSWANYPMDLIETFFTTSGGYLSSVMPEGWFTDLLINGVWAGLGGVVVFVPQIAILFFLISILEESGYMSRAVFLFDGLMQRFGMNGRSVVALISSGACAIPAIMSTRTISNFRERLITIFVSPFISCSARIPVYAILTAFVVPDVSIMGIFNLRGIVFTSLYLFGIAAALIVAFLLKKSLKDTGTSTLAMELPLYKPPVWNNVWLNVRSKVMAFIQEAGKIIVLISVVLWFLASFGPGENMAKAERLALTESEKTNMDDKSTENLIASYKIEASFAGIMGKWIEPAISPLGFDWKIGIAIITSFAAREVFVGTMATIYSIGSADEEITLRQRMAREVKKDGVTPVFNVPTSSALLVFYVFALQCMSTIAVVRKETGTWKWPLLQFFVMGIMAYFGAFITYRLLI